MNDIELEADEFLLAFKEKEDVLLNYNSGRIVVIGNVFFSRENYNSKMTKIFNVTFNDAVLFDEVDFGIGIGFENCIFKSVLNFKDAVASGYDSIFSAIEKSIYFNECVFQDNLTFRGTESRLEYGINIERNSKVLTGLYIRSLRCIESGLTINETKVEGNLQIDQCSFEKDGIIINKSEFGKDCEIEIKRTKLEKIFFCESIFDSEIQIENSEIVLLIHFYSCIFNNGILIHNIESNGILTIVNSAFKQLFKLLYSFNSGTEKSGIKNIDIKSCTFHDNMEITGDIYSLRQTPLINSFTLNSTTQLEGDIILENLTINQIYIKGINQKSTLKFNTVFCNQVNIENFVNYSKIIFNNVASLYTLQSKFPLLENAENFKKTIPEFCISNSDLGHTKFWNFDFSTFDKVELTNVIFLNCEFHHVKWFTNQNFNIKDRSPKINREIFRQLKSVISAQGDFIQSLEFKNLEMAEYMKELKSKPTRNWKDCSDLILMFLNRSNSYGINWIKPALLAVLYTAICYVAMSSVFYLNNPEIINPECGKITNFFIYTWLYKTRFFLLLDPTYKLTDVFHNRCTITSSLYLLAIIQKIGIAYLIFQTIAAFRKYLK